MTTRELMRVGRRNLWSLYAFTGTSRLWFDGGLWVLYFQHRGISLFDVGILEALLHIVVLVSDVPIGLFADRFSWRLSLALSAVFGVGYCLCALVSTNLWIAAVAFAARGLQVTLTSGSLSSIAYESASMAGMADKYRVISGRLLAISLVSMGTAEALGGTLAAYAWPTIYVAFAISNAASLVALLWLKEPKTVARRNSEESPRPSTIAIARDALAFARGSRAFVKWIVVSACLSGFVATFAMYGQALLLHAGWTLVGIGILTGVENGFGAVVALLSDRVTGRYGEPRTMTALSVIASTGLVLFAWLPGGWMSAGFLLASAALNLADPVIDQGLNKLIPSAQRATLLSANSTAFSVFMIVGFPSFGALAKHVGLMQAAYISSGVAVICIMSAVVWWRGTARAQVHELIDGSVRISGRD